MNNMLCVITFLRELSAGQSKNIVDRIINGKLKYEIYLHIRQNERLQAGHLEW